MTPSYPAMGCGDQLHVPKSPQGWREGRLESRAEKGARKVMMRPRKEEGKIKMRRM